MSYNYGNLLGCYTETEISAGIPFLIENGSDESRAEDRPSPEELEAAQIAYEKNYNRIMKKIAALDSPSNIKSEAIRQLIINEKDYIIKRYAKKEGLQEQHVSQVTNEDFLPFSVRSFLTRFLDIAITNNINEEVLNLTNKMIYNKELNTPYDRVSELQLYIHKKAEETNGEDAASRLPRQAIRVLLSCARLNLSIYDLFRHSRIDNYEKLLSHKLNSSSRYSKTSYFEYMYRKSQFSADLESSFPSIKPVINGRYIPNWSVRHKKPISYYCRPETRLKIEEIDNLFYPDDGKFNETYNIADLKKRCAELFCETALDQSAKFISSIYK